MKVRSDAIERLVWRWLPVGLAVVPAALGIVASISGAVDPRDASPTVVVLVDGSVHLLPLAAELEVDNGSGLEASVLLNGVTGSRHCLEW